jgi:hypothetical protein
MDIMVRKRLDGYHGKEKNRMDIMVMKRLGLKW